MKRVLWGIVILLIIAGLAAVRLHRTREKENAPKLADHAVAVQVAPVARGRVARTRHVLGRVIGGEEAAAAPRIMARVLEVRVREGDRVRAGSLLAQLDTDELDDAVAQAEAAAEAAAEDATAAEVAREAQRNTTARDRTLYEAGAISAEQWDHSRSAEAGAAAALESARAHRRIAGKALERARTRLAYARIEAPFSGVVSARLADPGDLAVPGRPLFRLVRGGGVRVRAEVPMEDLAVLRPGMPAALSNDASRVSAAVSRVFPAASSGRLAVVEIDLDEPPATFIAGAPVGIDLELGAAEGLVVPADALLEGEAGAHVFRVADGTLQQVAVQVVERSADRVVVDGPLQPGNTLVVARPSRLMTLSDGQPVTVPAAVPAEE